VSCKEWVEKADSELRRLPVKVKFRSILYFLTLFLLVNGVAWIPALILWNMMHTEICEVGSARLCDEFSSILPLIAVLAVIAALASGIEARRYGVRVMRETFERLAKEGVEIVSSTVWRMMRRLESVRRIRSRFKELENMLSDYGETDEKLKEYEREMSLLVEEAKNIENDLRSEKDSLRLAKALREKCSRIAELEEKVEAIATVAAELKGGLDSFINEAKECWEWLRELGVVSEGETKLSSAVMMTVSKVFKLYKSLEEDRRIDVMMKRISNFKDRVERMRERYRLIVERNLLPKSEVEGRLKSLEELLNTLDVIEGKANELRGKMGKALTELKGLASVYVLDSLTGLAGEEEDKETVAKAEEIYNSIRTLMDEELKNIEKELEEVTKREVTVPIEETKPY